MGDNSGREGSRPQSPGYGPRSPEGSVFIARYETPDRGGFILEKRSRVQLAREYQGYPLAEVEPQFGVQLFIGQPFNGQVITINPNIIETWQESIIGLSRVKDGTPNVGTLAQASLEQIAVVSSEEGVHGMIVDQGIHPKGANGICYHRQKVWYSNQKQISFGTCQCLKSYIQDG